MRTQPLTEALGEEISSFGDNWKHLRGDDQYAWGNKMKVCRGCVYTGKDTVFEFIKWNGKRSQELHYYSNISPFKMEEEKCPYCLGERKFQIITDGMKIVSSKKEGKGKGKSKYIGVAFREDGNRKKPWDACIGIGKKNKRIGSYYSDIGAARAYNKEACKLGRTLNSI